MTSAFEAISLILVGALWGCTNPLLRQGAVESGATQSPLSSSSSSPPPLSSSSSSLVHSLIAFFAKLQYSRVWLPYVINQSGSLLFYVTLGQSDLSLAVPICNALALVFSILTTFVLGEHIHKPFQTVLGATFIVMGVTLCLYQNNLANHHEANANSRTTPDREL